MTLPDDLDRRVAGAALGLAAFLFPLLTLVAPLGVAPLGTVLGVACLPLVIRRRLWRGLPWPLVAGLSALAGWALLSALWAVDPAQAARGALRFLLVSGLGCCGLAVLPALDEAARTRAAQALLAGLAAAAALFLVLLQVEPSGSHGIDTTKRGVTILALLIWPARRLVSPLLPRGGIVAATLAVCGVVLAGSSFSAKVATMIGLAVVVAVALQPRRTVGVLAGLAIVVVLALPWLAERIPSPHYTFQSWDFLPYSSHHRSTIWGFVGARIVEHPWLGWGMDSSRAIPGGEVEILVQRFAPDGRVVMELTEPWLPLHPHNAALQVWLELGGVGVLIVLALLCWVLFRVAQAPRAERGDRAALVFSTFAVACVSFGLWQSWWQASFWMLALMAALDPLRPGAVLPSATKETPR